jgi:hypothetical protein
MLKPSRLAVYIPYEVEGTLVKETKLRKYRRDG